MKRRITGTAIVNGIDTAKNSHCPCDIVRKADVFIPVIPETNGRGRKVTDEGKDVNSFGVVFSSHAD
jgi:hypothetical protein